ncbi:hypothetical protein LZ32DRAFT_242491 [Colletotrichum eremochloae]|nr:hypothetical protein LZ32DRAFT_242491 [Colletotrichum eremochloae]
MIFMFRANGSRRRMGIWNEYIQQMTFFPQPFTCSGPLDSAVRRRTLLPPSLAESVSSVACSRIESWGRETGPRAKPHNLYGIHPTPSLENMNVSFPSPRLPITSMPAWFSTHSPCSLSSFHEVSPPRWRHAGRPFETWFDWGLVGFSTDSFVLALGGREA